MNIPGRPAPDGGRPYAAAMGSSDAESDALRRLLATDLLAAVPYLHRLRRGEQVMAMADPYNAVRTALSAVQPPRL